MRIRNRLIIRIIFLTYLFSSIPLIIHSYHPDNIKKIIGSGHFILESRSDAFFDFSIEGTFEQSKDFIICKKCTLKILNEPWMSLGMDGKHSKKKGFFIEQCRDWIPGLYSNFKKAREPFLFKKGAKFVADEIILLKEFIVTKYNSLGDQRGLCNIGFNGNLEFTQGFKKYYGNVTRPTRLFFNTIPKNFNKERLEERADSERLIEQKPSIKSTDIITEKNELLDLEENLNTLRNSSETIETKKENNSQSNIDICIDLGFKKGTEGLKNCVLELN